MPDSYLNAKPSTATVPFPNGSAKRSKQPPLFVPPGHVAFRLLCHASRIGGVIGKSGSVIKQLQQSTGAKIRVEDAPPDCSDRVIAVIAPAVLTSKITLGESRKKESNGFLNPHLDNESDKSEKTEDNDSEESGISKAQEALLKVFERILEVAAESNGVEVGVGVASCRLLVETKQVGSIIGKQGKVVEKIRKDTGTRIRVLSDKLPGCADRSDEMVEIEGDVLAVKKALLAVSHRLQDCLPTDKLKIIGRPAEVFLNRTSPDMHVNSLSPKNVVLPAMASSSTSYNSGVHPLSMVTDRMPMPDMKIPLQEVTFRVLCSNDRIGGVIGKGGTIIKALEVESGASIMVGPTVAGCEERLVIITASENLESRYSPAQKALRLVFARSIQTGFEKGLDSSSSKAPVTARLVVPSHQAGCLLGKGGAIVSEMRKASSANIWLIGGEQIPKCVLENEEIVQISGEFSNVQNAMFHVTSRLRDNLLTNMVNIAGTRNSPILTDSSFGRSRDAAAASMQPSVSTSHGLGQHTTTLKQKLERLEISHNADNPSSPMMDVKVNPLGHTDVGKGFTSLKGGAEIGSGSRTAFVANTTVEIVLPENVIDSVYGENGSNLTRLRQISGAKVVLHEPHPGTSDRIVVISGTPDETQAAQSLLQAFILTGS